MRPVTLSNRHAATFQIEGNYPPFVTANVQNTVQPSCKVLFGCGRKVNFCLFPIRISYSAGLKCLYMVARFFVNTSEMEDREMGLASLPWQHYGGKFQSCASLLVQLCILGCDLHIRSILLLTLLTLQPGRTVVTSGYI